MCPPSPQLLRPRPVVFIHDAGAMGLGPDANDATSVIAQDACQCLLSLS
jgi:hypothetical protein